MRTQQQLIFLLCLVGTFVCSVIADAGPCCDDYCYSNDQLWPQKSQYATKTAYQVAKAASTSNDYRIPNCTPKKFWILNRHGTRYPTVKEMKNMKKLEQLRDEIIENYQVRKTQPQNGSLCDSDFTALSAWTWNSSITDDQDQFLTTQGWRDLKLIAINYKRLFSDLLGTKYDADRFYFRHTKTQRTKASFQAFVDGLFGPDSSRNIIVPPAPENDTLLRPYDLCPAWEANSAAKMDPSSEYKKFMASPIFQKLISDVSVRLGFKELLTAKQIDTIWDMCRYEQSWELNGYSAWCAVLTKPQIDLMEYLEDVKYYYKQGYGHEMNKNVACYTVKDMLTHLQSETDPQVVAYFTHSSAVQLFLTSLGIATDKEPLTAANFEQQRGRNWRTSKIGPFAANFAAVKYECSSAEKNRIMFFLNEKPIKFDWCKSGSLCDLTTVLSHLKRFNEADCSQLYCTANSSPAPLGMSAILAIACILFVKLYRGNF